MNNNIVITILIFQLTVAGTEILHQSPEVKVSYVPFKAITTPPPSDSSKSILFKINTTKLQTGYEYCYYYNKEKCSEDRNGDREGCDSYIEQCKKGHSCFALWNSTKLIMKGCYNVDKSCRKDSCHDEGLELKKLKFCCCVGHFCNNNMTYDEYKGTEYDSRAVTKDNGDSSPIYIMKLVFYVLMPVVICLLLSGYMIYMWRNKELSSPIDHLITNNKQMLQEDEYVDPPHLQLQLLDVIASGRFGNVWRANCFDKIMAVKVFNDVNSWRKERDIYLLPKMANNDCLLKFISAEKKNSIMDNEYWIIAEYHSNGSLCDFLKKNTIDWDELIKLSTTIAEGIRYLHSTVEPSIVHRDIKSHNILVKDDLSACIGDFGLAVSLNSTRDAKDCKMQVGTRRYMSPEVLEGAMNFELIDFYHIDMYAMGLVYWELLTRCRGENDEVEEYKLPFTDEAGEHPTIAKMHEVVVYKRTKPKMPKHFGHDEVTSGYISIILECLDYDDDGRLAAGTVMSKLMRIMVIASQQQDYKQQDEKLPLLNDSDKEISS